MQQTDNKFNGCINIDEKVLMNGTFPILFTSVWRALVLKEEWVIGPHICNLIDDTFCCKLIHELVLNVISIHLNSHRVPICPIFYVVWLQITVIQWIYYKALQNKDNKIIK